MKFYIFLIFIFIDTVVQAQWQSVGPFGGKVLSLIEKNGIIFAGTENHGIFRSLDNCETWEQVNKGLTYSSVEPTEINDFGVVNNSLFSCSDLGLFVSNNDGNSWFNLNSQITDDNWIPKIYFIATQSNKIVIATDRGVFLSLNAGNSWEFIGLNEYFVSSLALIDNKIFAGSPYGLFLTTDNGISWQTLKSETNQSINSIKISNGKIVIGVNYGGIFISNDLGDSWKGANNGITDKHISALYVKDSIYFAGTYSGQIFRSTNSGNEWQMVYAKTGSVWQVGINSILFTGLNFIAATDYDGVLFSPNDGINWQKKSTGLFSRQILDVFLKGNEIFAGTDEGVYSSTNYGNSWYERNKGLSGVMYRPPGVSALGLFNDKILAGCGTGIYYSTDNGNNWITGTQDIGYISSFILTGNEIIASGSSVYFKNAVGFFKSKDGIKWTKGDEFPLVGSFLIKNSFLFAGTYSGIFRCSDSGETWEDISDGLTNKRINSIVASGNNIFAGSEGGGIFISTNDGNYWNEINSPALFVRCLVVHDSIIFAGTGLGMYYSENNGNNWIEINKGLINCYIKTIEIDEDNIYLSTDKGLWIRSISEITSIHEGLSNTKQLKYFLLQNFPNPFNPSTTIRYQISQAGFVSLKVYDVLGKEAATLVNEEKPAGEYNVTFNGRNLSSGVYFYQLKSGNFVETRKLILMK